MLSVGTLLFSGCESPGTQPERVDTPKTLMPSAGLSALDQSKYNKAIEQIDNSDFKKALKILQKLDKKYQSHVGVKINLATSYLALGRIDNAAAVAKVALELNNTLAEIHNLLGLIAVEQNHYRKAETEYLLAVTLDKDLANAHYNAALLYDIYFQDIPKAYRFYANYLALVPNDQAVKDWLEQLKYSLELEP